ncbi:TIGR02679 family protein [Kribbella speibonae]|uniref:TIGR02679 family protein n=1 Tax=Kribbella speibonae TaxID=1572660 RepID=A0A4R0IIP3_9ACTN|nr:TIGR02679 family protein [Kribbella speibonae]TCC32040.1 TIGR02679 family protein [Kribbella speibonae]
MSTPMPDPVRRQLASPALAGIWRRARSHVEQNGLSPTGKITVDLETATAEVLGGLLGRTIAARKTKIDIADLDQALRGSAAQCGLLSVLEVLGGPLKDRSALRTEKAAQTASLWAQLDTELKAVGLQDRPWVPRWIDGLRRAGLLARARGDASLLISQVCAVLGALRPALDGGESTGRWELGQLASSHTKGAHGLDSQALAAAAVLRAVAAATDRPDPTTAQERRDLWLSVGVNPDNVSGTVIVWGLRPPGKGSWATMMRSRADLGLVTHITLQEWEVAAGLEPWAAPAELIRICENPQVLQAAAAARVSRPLLCVSGNPSIIGLLAIAALAAQGIPAAYHGDFDAAGIEIANRLHRLGVEPWRMSRRDYLDAVATLSPLNSIALAGDVPSCEWDAELTATMNHMGLAVHEEALLDALLGDLS